MAMTKKQTLSWLRNISGGGEEVETGPEFHFDYCFLTGLPGEDPATTFVGVDKYTQGVLAHVVPKPCENTGLLAHVVPNPYENIRFLVHVVPKPVENTRLWRRNARNGK